MDKYSNRFELKYIIDVYAIDNLINDFLNYMQEDYFSGEKAEYRVNSLYFDTENLKAYLDKINGEKIRRKLRFRTYTINGKETGSFLEVKKKYNNNVRKSRINISEFQISSFLKLSNLPADIKFLCLSEQLIPLIYIKYDRKAYEGIYDKNLRITIDNNILVSKAMRSGLSFDSWEQAFDLNKAILEIKFSNNIPYWLLRYIKRNRLRLNKVSKYCLLFGY